MVPEPFTLTVRNLDWCQDTIISIHSTLLYKLSIRFDSCSSRESVWECKQKETSLPLLSKLFLLPHLCKPSSFALPWAGMMTFAWSLPGWLFLKKSVQWHQCFLNSAKAVQTFLVASAELLQPPRLNKSKHFFTLSVYFWLLPMASWRFP